MEFVLSFVLLAYLVPFTVAASRRHPATNAILAVNLLLGWTGVGWWFALAWAAPPPPGKLGRWLAPLEPAPARRNARREAIRRGLRPVATARGVTPAATPGRRRRPQLAVVASRAEVSASR